MLATNFKVNHYYKLGNDVYKYLGFPEFLDKLHHLEGKDYLRLTTEQLQSFDFQQV